MWLIALSFPQKLKNLYKLENTKWLEENTNCKIIHPSTDCEMDNDDYGLSKRKQLIILKIKVLKLKCFKRLLLTELNSNNSLLEWFITKKGEVFGYTKAM